MKCYRKTKLLISSIPYWTPIIKTENKMKPLWNNSGMLTPMNILASFYIFLQVRIWESDNLPLFILEIVHPILLLKALKTFGPHLINKYKIKLKLHSFPYLLKKLIKMWEIIYVTPLEKLAVPSILTKTKTDGLNLHICYGNYSLAQRMNWLNLVLKS